VENGLGSEKVNPTDDWIMIRVNPPRIIKTVHYVYPRKRDSNTRCVVQSGAMITIHTHLPIESHDDNVHPSCLWPGSVVDELYVFPQTRVAKS